MSYKIKCDRCGAEKSRSEPEHELHYTAVRGSMWGYDDSIHLCEKCFKAFLEWMKGWKPEVEYDEQEG